VILCSLTFWEPDNLTKAKAINTYRAWSKVCSEYSRAITILSWVLDMDVATILTILLQSSKKCPLVFYGTQSEKVNYILKNVPDVIGYYQQDAHFEGNQTDHSIEEMVECSIVLTYHIHVRICTFAH